MQKYFLRPEITGTTMEEIGLPIDPISEFGIIYLYEKDIMALDDDNMEHHHIEIFFQYKNDKGENCIANLIKQTFDNLFIKANE